ncbi:MAG TPA: DUF2141 domain-containing protein [bacterium]|nr:DUF2141 domain-containing protein [bacterium]
MKRSLAAIFVAILCLALTGQEKKSTLTVVLKGLKVQGTVYVSLYDKDNGFPTKSENAFKNEMKKVAAATEKVVFANIPAGEYAVSVWHDENDNGKMETSLIGIPKEGLGVSNNAKGKMGPPKFKDAKFVIDKESQVIEINVKY